MGRAGDDMNAHPLVTIRFHLPGTQVWERYWYHVPKVGDYIRVPHPDAHVTEPADYRVKYVVWSIDDSSVDIRLEWDG